MHGIANSIAPLAVIITPANTKPGAYDPNLSNNVPATGGPTSDAIPWNNNNRPNAVWEETIKKSGKSELTNLNFH